MDGYNLNALVAKVEQYERFLHMLQLYAEVAMNPDATRALIGNACRWSYAHRAGNGELTDVEQEARVRQAFDKLLDITCR